MTAVIESPTAKLPLLVTEANLIERFAFPVKTIRKLIESGRLQVVGYFYAPPGETHCQPLFDAYTALELVNG